MRNIYYFPLIIYYLDIGLLDLSDYKQFVKSYLSVLNFDLFPDEIEEVKNLLYNDLFGLLWLFKIYEKEVKR